MYFWVVTGTVFGPAVSYGFIDSGAGWRWIYYLITITNGVATILWIIFYHPPTYVMVNSRSKLEMIKEFDYIGFVLFTGGLLIFLIGLSWGGTVYPWKSAAVIASMICGGLALIVLAVYEHYVAVPLIPPALFKNRGTYPCIIRGV
jgi:MFS family permease